MPYSGASDPKIPDYIQKLSEAKKKQWVAIWNSVYEKTGDESRAFSTANGVVLHGKKDLESVGDVNGGFLTNRKEMTDEWFPIQAYMNRRTGTTIVGSEEAYSWYVVQRSGDPFQNLDEATHTVDPWEKAIVGENGGFVLPKSITRKLLERQRGLTFPHPHCGEKIWAWTVLHRRRTESQRQRTQKVQMVRSLIFPPLLFSEADVQEVDPTASLELPLFTIDVDGTDALIQSELFDDPTLEAVQMRLAEMETFPETFTWTIQQLVLRGTIEPMLEAEIVQNLCNLLARDREQGSVYRLDENKWVDMNDRMMGETKGLREYQQTVRTAMRAFWKGQIDRDTFIDQMGEGIQHHFYQAWTHGAGANLSEDGLSALQDDTDLEVGRLDDLADWIDENRSNLKLDDILNRGDLWVSSYATMRDKARLYEGDPEEIIEWLRNEQKDSCEDCLEYHGQRKTRQEWRDLGIYPGSHDLACGGWACGCRFRPTGEFKSLKGGDMANLYGGWWINREGNVFELPGSQWSYNFVANHPELFHVENSDDYSMGMDVFVRGNIRLTPQDGLLNIQSYNVNDSGIETVKELAPMTGCNTFQWSDPGRFNHLVTGSIEDLENGNLKSTALKEAPGALITPDGREINLGPYDGETDLTHFRYFIEHGTEIGLSQEEVDAFRENTYANEQAGGNALIEDDPDMWSYLLDKGFMSLRLIMGQMLQLNVRAKYNQENLYRATLYLGENGINTGDPRPGWIYWTDENGAERELDMLALLENGTKRKVMITPIAVKNALLKSGVFDDLGLTADNLVEHLEGETLNNLVWAAEDQLQADGFRIDNTSAREIRSILVSLKRGEIKAPWIFGKLKEAMNEEAVVNVAITSVIEEAQAKGRYFEEATDFFDALELKLGADMREAIIECGSDFLAENPDILIGSEIKWPKKMAPAGTMGGFYSGTKQHLYENYADLSTQDIQNHADTLFQEMIYRVFIANDLPSTQQFFQECKDAIGEAITDFIADRHTLKTINPGVLMAIRRELQNAKDQGEPIDPQFIIYEGLEGYGPFNEVEAAEISRAIQKEALAMGVTLEDEFMSAKILPVGPLGSQFTGDGLAGGTQIAGESGGAQWTQPDMDDVSDSDKRRIAEMLQDGNSPEDAVTVLMAERVSARNEDVGAANNDPEETNRMLAVAREIARQGNKYLKTIGSPMQKALAQFEVKEFEGSYEPDPLSEDFAESDFAAPHKDANQEQEIITYLEGTYELDINDIELLGDAEAGAWAVRINGEQTFLITDWDGISYLTEANVNEYDFGSWPPEEVES